MAVRITKSSRLQFSDLRQIDGVTFWDTVDLPVFFPSERDISHRVQGFDRIDTIAQRYYGDPELWWVIAWANDLEILPTDLNENDVLVVPNATFVQSTLLSRTRP